ncbi:MAG: hypothetical protein ACKO96_43365, partial [Flammeovirgaceae bacterium]
SEQVGLNISLRYIFKPSYSPHCINSNVVGKLASDKVDIEYENTITCDLNTTWTSWRNLRL